MTHYGVGRDQAKELFIRICFYGTFGGWCIENKIGNREPLALITSFEREVRDIAGHAKKANPSLYETARQKRKKDGENDEDKVMGTFFSLYCQEYESRIVETVLCHLQSNTKLVKYKMETMGAGQYEYDGVKILKENVDALDGSVEEVVSMLNERTYALTGFQLEWCCKPITEFYDIDKWIEQVHEDEKPNDQLIHHPLRCHQHCH